jgi:hypothetical protein
MAAGLACQVLACSYTFSKNHAAFNKAAHPLTMKIHKKEVNFNRLLQRNLIPLN